MHKIIIFACDLFWCRWCFYAVNGEKSQNSFQKAWSCCFHHLFNIGTCSSILFHFFFFFFAVVQLKCEVRQRIMNLTTFLALFYQGWDFRMWLYLVGTKTLRLLFTTSRQLCIGLKFDCETNVRKSICTHLYKRKKKNWKLKMLHRKNHLITLPRLIQWTRFLALRNN